MEVKIRPLVAGPRLEIDEQKEAWKWLASVQVGDKCLQDYSFMCPNGTQLAGGRNRRAQYMSSLKAQGFKTGVSDLVIAYPVGEFHSGDYPGGAFHGAYIELKRVREAFKGPAALAASVSEDQKGWLRLMASVGYWVYVAYGAEDFKVAVRSYLQRKNQPPLDFSL
jgi:hypothetical protein